MAENDGDPRYPIALSAICEALWLIAPPALDTIISIAQTGSGPNYREGAESLFDALAIEPRATPVMRNRTAVLSFDGPVFPKGNLLTRSSGATSLRALQGEFSAAMADQNVEHIVLAINSPGGVADGIAAFAEQVYAARGVKPVTAVAEGVASAAYWIASAAESFVLTPTGQAGSIGVVLSARKSQSNDGEIQIISTQSPLKRQDPASSEGRTALQARADTVAQVFIDAIARNRGVDSKTVAEKFGRGGMLSAADAVAAGMADRIGTLEQVLSAGFAGIQPRSEAMTTAANAPAITRESILADHPAIAEGFRADERARIQSVQAQSMPGHEALIAQLMFDGKTTGPEAAVQVLAAERAARGTALAQRREEAPKPVKAATEPPAAQPIDPSMPLEDRCRAEWQADAKIRSEFLAVEDYIAFAKAEEAGRVRILRGKSAE